MYPSQWKPEVDLRWLVAVVGVAVASSCWRSTAGDVAAECRPALEEHSLWVANVGQHHLSEEAQINGIEVRFGLRRLVQPSLDETGGRSTLAWAGGEEPIERICAWRRWAQRLQHVAAVLAVSNV